MGEQLKRLTKDCLMKDVDEHIGINYDRYDHV